MYPLSGASLQRRVPVREPIGIVMNATQIKIIALSALIMALVLVACNPSAAETPSAGAALSNGYDPIYATGKIVPEREATLSFPAGGVVEKLLVSRGDSVQEGQVLVQLEGSEQQKALVSAAELELLNAEAALEKLYKDTDLAAAEALRSAETAEQALEDLYEPEVQQAQAMIAVAEAEKVLDRTKRNLEIVTNVPSQSAIDQTHANLLLAENKLNKTLDTISDVERQLKKFSGAQLPEDIKRPLIRKLRQALEGLEFKRSQDQLSYNNSRDKYDDLLKPPDPIDVAVAEAEYLTAQAQLLQAQRDLERIVDGPEAGDVAVLEAQIEKGYRDYETYKNGPDPDDITQAEARVENARAQVVAAQEILTELELTAPYGGVISEVYIHPSEWVAPGSPVLLLADLDNLKVETTDLSEIDVARIEVGDQATVTFDALPDRSVGGSIVWIAPKADTDEGVNFPVILELNEIPPELRWGMTAFLDIEDTSNE